jgi:hypothetical protein
MRETEEQVTGPNNGLIPLILVLLMCAFTAGLLWTLHVKYYLNPINPLQPVAPAVQQHPVNNPAH